MKVISPARRETVTEAYLADASRRNVVKLVQKVRQQQANVSAWAKVKAYLNEEVAILG